MSKSFPIKGLHGLEKKKKRAAQDEHSELERAGCNLKVPLVTTKKTKNITDCQDSAFIKI